MIVNILDTNKKYKSIVINQSDDFEAFKDKVKSKLKLDFVVEKFRCVENNIQIDDDDLLNEFIEKINSEARVFSLIPVGETNKENEDEEKCRSEDEDYDKIALSSLKLSQSKLYSDVKSSKPSMLNEISSLRDQLEGMKHDLCATKNSTLVRKEEENCVVLEKKIETDKHRNEEKLKLIEEKKKKLLEEYERQKFASKKTEEIKTSEVEEIELKKAKLELRQAKISRMFLELKKAEQVDICFMIDCTGSMMSYIDEAKSVAHRVVDKLGKRFVDLKLRCAFVGYRDHCDGENRVSVLPFTSNRDHFKSWVASVVASGGGDECEDIFGGLEAVNLLKWQNMTRVLFHIGDAPCHGRRFHIGANDNYVDGDPRGLNITSLLADIAAKNIDYYFAEINTSTLKMVQEFNKELLANQGREIKIVKLCGAGDLFESVTTSITVSIMSSKSVSMHDGHGKPLKDYKVDPNPIDWSDMSKFERFDACVYEPVFESDLSDIKENKVEYTKRNVQLWKAARPFAKGGLRYAFAALINMGTKEKPKMTKCVIKESIFLAPDYNVASYYEEMIEIQVIAKCMAERFMLVSKGDKSLKFLSVSMVQVEKTGIYYSAEEFVDGEFVKWTNNAGEVNEEDYAATLNSFSHWTYDASNEYLVVTDLQGFRVGDAYLLTDPAITCLEDPFRFSSTNLGVKGLKKFFTTHQCNPICHYLGLKKNKYQTRPTRDCDTVKSKWIGV